MVIWANAKHVKMRLFQQESSPSTHLVTKCEGNLKVFSLYKHSASSHTSNNFSIEKRRFRSDKFRYCNTLMPLPHIGTI